MTVAVASSLAGLVGASLMASRDAVVPVIALSACGAVVYFAYWVRPKARLQRAARIGVLRGEFHVVYQPIVDTRTRHCVGVEALLRWGHPKFGAGCPELFIGALGGMRLLGAWTSFVLRGVVVLSVQNLALRFENAILINNLNNHGLLGSRRHAAPCCKRLCAMLPPDFARKGRLPLPPPAPARIAREGLCFRLHCF